MKKRIISIILVLAVVLSLSACGEADVVPLSVESSMLVFETMEDGVAFIEQVKDGSIDYDNYELSSVVSATATSTNLATIAGFTYLSSETAEFESMIIGNYGVSVSYNLGYDFSDMGLSDYEEQLLNTITLTTYSASDPTAIFQGLFLSGTYEMAEDGNSFYGMLGEYGLVQVWCSESSVLYLYAPFTAAETGFAYYSFE